MPNYIWDGEWFVHKSLYRGPRADEQQTFEPTPMTPAETAQYIYSLMRKDLQD